LFLIFCLPFFFLTTPSLEDQKTGVLSLASDPVPFEPPFFFLFFFFVFSRYVLGRPRNFFFLEAKLFDLKTEYFSVSRGPLEVFLFSLFLFFFMAVPRLFFFLTPYVKAFWRRWPPLVHSQGSVPAVFPVFLIFLFNSQLFTPLTAVGP